MKTQTQAARLARAAGAALLAISSLAMAAGTAQAAAPPYIVAPGLGSNNVEIIDQNTGKVARTVYVRDHPFIANAQKSGDKVYFDTLGLTDSHVSVLHTNTWNVSQIPVDGLPFATLLSPDDKTLYVLQANGVISVVDTATDKIRDRWNLGNIPAGLEISPDGSKVYISFVTSQLGVYDAKTGKLLKPLINSGGLVPAWLGISADGKRLYSLNFSSATTAVINTDTWRQIALIKEPDSTPTIVTESPDASKVYITDFAGRVIDIYRTTDFKKVGGIHLPGLAMEVDLGPDGYIYANDWSRSSAPFRGVVSATAFFLASSQTASLFTPSAGNLYKIDPLTDQIVRSTKTVSSPTMLDFLPAKP